MRRSALLASASLVVALGLVGPARADFHVDCIGIASGHATVSLVANPDGTLTFSGLLNCPGATSMSIDALELGAVTPSGIFSPLVDPCAANPGQNNCSIPAVDDVVATAPTVSCSGVEGCVAPITTSATTAEEVLDGTYQVGMLVSVNVGGANPHPFALRFGRWSWSGGQPTPTCVPLGLPPGSTGFCT